MTDLSPWLAAIAVVVAVNPMRMIGSFPAPKVVRLGVALVAVAYLIMGVIAAPLLEAINVSPPTLRVGAGLVLIVGAVRDLLLPPPASEPALPGVRAALVPVALPMLLRPHVAILAVSVGASDGLAPLVLGVLATSAVTLWAARPFGPVAERIGRWLAVAAAVVAIGVGVVLAVDGVFSV